MKFVLLSARLVVSVILVFGAVTALNAQDQPAEKRNKRGVDSTQTLDASKTPDSLEPAEYSYEFSQPNFFIKHVVLQHDSSGKGQISFERQDAGEPITEQLQFSPAALKRVIALWEALHYLSPESSYQSEKQFPHLGTMTVAVKKAGVDRKTTFNWTENKDAAALVDEYKHAANQAIFIFDINLSRQNQPLESPKLMDELERLVIRKELSDTNQLLPLLEDLSNDERLPLIARNHATRILKKIQKG